MADEEDSFGIEILSRLFSSGSYEGIIDSILGHLSGVELTALQVSVPACEQFITTHYWSNAARQQRLQAHWDCWIPTRLRTELGQSVTCLAQHELSIFCGMKSGLVLVYDQNVLLQSELEGHEREVLGMAVSAELLVTVARDLQMISWSVRHKVRRHSQHTGD